MGLLGMSSPELLLAHCSEQRGDCICEDVQGAGVYWLWVSDGSCLCVFRQVQVRNACAVLSSPAHV